MHEFFHPFNTMFISFRILNIKFNSSSPFQLFIYISVEINLSYTGSIYSYRIK